MNTAAMGALIIVVLVVCVLSAMVEPRVEFAKKINFEKKAGEKWIGLISDTHVPVRAKAIPSKVFELFEKVDLIIHAGDAVELGVLKDLEKMAPVIAVHGNMDFGEVGSEFPAMNSTEVAERKIGVVHDAGIFGTEKMKRIAEENGFDILIFGHTHKQFFMIDGDRIFINPGSPTNPIPPFLVKSSVAVLRIDEKVAEPIFIEV